MPYTYATTSNAPSPYNGSIYSSNFHTTFYNTYGPFRPGSYVETAQGGSGTTYGYTAYTGWGGNIVYTASITATGSYAFGGGRGVNTGLNITGNNAQAGYTEQGYSSSSYSSSSSASSFNATTGGSHSFSTSGSSTWSNSKTFTTTVVSNITSLIYSSSIATSSTIQVAASNGTSVGSTTCNDSVVWVNTITSTQYSTSTYSVNLTSDYITGYVVSAYLNEILATPDTVHYPINPINYSTQSSLTIWQTDISSIITGVAPVYSLVPAFTTTHVDYEVTVTITSSTVSTATLTLTTYTGTDPAEFPQQTTAITSNAITTFTTSATLGYVLGTNTDTYEGYFSVYNITNASLTTLSSFAFFTNIVGGTTYQEIGFTTYNYSNVLALPYIFNPNTNITIAASFTHTDLGHILAFGYIPASFDYQAYPQPLDAWQIPSAYASTDPQYLVVYPVGTTCPMNAFEARPGVSVPAIGSFSSTSTGINETTSWISSISSGNLSVYRTEKTGTFTTTFSSTYSWNGSGVAHSNYTTYATTFDAMPCGWIGHSSQPLIIGPGMTEITYNGTDYVSVTDFVASISQSSQTDNSSAIGLAREWANYVPYCDSYKAIGGNNFYVVFQRNKTTTNLQLT